MGSSWQSLLDNLVKVRNSLENTDTRLVPQNVALEGLFFIVQTMLEKLRDQQEAQGGKS